MLVAQYSETGCRYAKSISWDSLFNRRKKSSENLLRRCSLNLQNTWQHVRHFFERKITLHIGSLGDRNNKITVMFWQQIHICAQNIKRESNQEPRTLLKSMNAKQYFDKIKLSILVKDFKPICQIWLVWKCRMLGWALWRPAEPYLSSLGVGKTQIFPKPKYFNV
jgi:hypothetical protein